MKITGVSASSQFKNLKNNTNKQVSNPQHSVSFQGEDVRRATAATLAALAGVTLVGCGNQSAVAETTPPSSVHQEYKDQTVGTVGSSLDVMQSGNSDKILLTDINLFSLPVSELYLPSVDNRTILKPNSELPRNSQGTIIVTITEKSSDKMNEGNTLGEIVSKVYSDELENYEGEEYTAVFNKLIDEVVQANPSLSAYVQKELGDNADSYEDIANLDLYKGSSSADQTLDTRLLTIPTVISWQVQGKEPINYNSFYTASTYVPKSATVNIVDGGNNLMNGEYKSFSEMIYGEYGEDISDEAYRDIVYGIVNDPRNAHHFEIILDGMNFYDIVHTGNINDLKRTLAENIDGDMVGISLPTVNTFRTNATEDNKNDGNKNLIIYQISPAAVKEGQNDRQILIVNNTSKYGKMSAGDVFILRDVLQFYPSPDGNGRFAYVENGKLVMNSKVNYQEDFATNILEQVVYGNLPIFTAQYEDENGVHPYGVFDVNGGYDTKGKTLEQIIQNSTINLERMMSFSFVDENGVSKFEDGVELNLPQFNYRLNQNVTVSKPSEPTVPTETEPTETVPTETEPTETEPTETIPTETEPTETEPTETIPTETEPTETEPTETIPTETEPTETEPTETEPTCDTNPFPDDPTDEEVPTLPTETEPTETVPTETEPTETVPTETEPTETQPSATEIDPVEPTETTPPTTEPTDGATEIDPVDPTGTTPTETEPTVTEPTETEPTETQPTCDDTSNPDVPTEEEIPTVPTESEPTETVPTETQPTVTEPTVTEPTETVPTETDPTCDDTSIPDVPTEEEIPTVPTESEPTETVPTETTPTETEPSSTQPTETQPSTGETDCDSPSDDDTPVDESIPGLGGESDVVSPEPETQPTQAPETQPTQAPETQPTQAPETQPTQAPESDADTGCGEEGSGDDYVEEETPSFANNIEAPAPKVEDTPVRTSEVKIEATTSKVEEAPAPAPEVNSETPAPAPAVESAEPAPVFEDVVVEEAVPVLQTGNKQQSAKSNDSLVVKLASFFVNKTADSKNKSKGISYNV